MRGFTEMLGKARPGRPNLTVVIGGALVAILSLVAILAPLVAPHDPLQTNDIIQDKAGNFIIPPFPPMVSPEFLLGSDTYGRDLLSRLIWGLRPTLMLVFVVALARLLIGAVIGILDGWYTGRRLGDFLSGLSEIAASVPLVLVALLILYMNGLERGLRPTMAESRLLPFVVALTATGWANVEQFMAERVRLVRHEPFIEASRALGAGDGRILVRHVVPQVLNLLPVLLSLEMGSILIVVAELGFLKLYVGGGVMMGVVGPGARDAYRLAASTPELAQMLSDAWESFFLLPWLMLYSGLLFFVSIFAFMLLGEGLKQQVLKEKGLVVPGLNLRQALGLGGRRGEIIPVEVAEEIAI